MTPSTACQFSDVVYLLQNPAYHFDCIEILLLSGTYTWKSAGFGSLGGDTVTRLWLRSYSGNSTDVMIQQEDQGTHCFFLLIDVSSFLKSFTVRDVSFKLLTCDAIQLFGTRQISPGFSLTVQNILFVASSGNLFTPDNSGNPYDIGKAVVTFDHVEYRLQKGDGAPLIVPMASLSSTSVLSTVKISYLDFYFSAVNGRREKDKIVPEALVLIGATNEVTIEHLSIFSTTVEGEDSVDGLKILGGDFVSPPTKMTLVDCSFNSLQNGIYFVVGKQSYSLSCDACQFQDCDRAIVRKSTPISSSRVAQIGFTNSEFQNLRKTDSFVSDEKEDEWTFFKCNFINSTLLLPDGRFEVSDSAFQIGGVVADSVETKLVMESCSVEDGPGMTLRKFASVSIGDGSILRNRKNKGGGIFASMMEGSSFEMSYVTVQQNSAVFGGGIMVERLGGTNASVVIKDSNVFGNNANFGGGILLNASSLDESMLIQSTIQKNTAYCQGGGAYIDTSKGQPSDYRRHALTNPPTFNEAPCGADSLGSPAILTYDRLSLCWPLKGLKSSSFASSDADVRNCTLRFQVLDFLEKPIVGSWNPEGFSIRLEQEKRYQHLQDVRLDDRSWFGSFPWPFEKDQVLLQLDVVLETLRKPVARFPITFAIDEWFAFFSFCASHNLESRGCYGIRRDDSQVCEGNGKCIFPNDCSCLSGYYDETCADFDCFGIEKDLPDSCGSHGICESPNSCNCSKGFYGLFCDTKGSKFSAVAIALPVSLFVVLGFGVVVVVSIVAVALKRRNNQARANRISRIPNERDQLLQ